jgi:hypothetical protein
VADFHRRGHVERRTLDRMGFQRRPLSEEEYERVEDLAGFESYTQHIEVSHDAYEPSPTGQVETVLPASSRTLGPPVDRHVNLINQSIDSSALSRLNPGTQGSSSLDQTI